jgi:hypothetical protein
MSDGYNHAELKELAKELDRPLHTLTVLAQDPFTADQETRLAGAQWFARLWKKRFEFGAKPGAKLHVHGFHYLLVSQATPIKKPDGSNYENTKDDENYVLDRGALDARYLGLVSSDDFDDQRTVEPTINDTAEATDPSIDIVGGIADLEIEYALPAFEIPKLQAYPPTILPHDHLEIFIEKSTQNEWLAPLCEQQGIDFQPGVGEFGYKRCEQIIERAEAHHPRTTRVGVITDFDCAGQSIPVAIARKVQFMLYDKGLNHLDIRVEPIALTHDQCVELELPRTPVKKDEKRGPAFEERYGEGQTELDAIDALHPGKLEELVQAWINTYREDDLKDRINDTESEADSEIDTINDEVHEEHAADIAMVEAAKEACNTEIEAAIKKFENVAKPVLKKIEDDLDDKAPGADDFDWPDPEEDLGDDDAMYDSTRDYVEQTDRFKEHQGKSIERAERREPTGEEATCINPDCERPDRKFIRYRSNQMTCSDKCRSAMQRARNRGAAEHAGRRTAVQVQVLQQAVHFRPARRHVLRQARVPAETADRTTAPQGRLWAPQKRWRA